MKNLLPILSIALLSTAVQAGLNIEEPKLDLTSKGAMEQAVEETSQSVSESVIIENELNEPENLWKSLDLDNDGSISKTEATSSKDIINQWEKLDANKDDKIDTVEFVQFYFQGKLDTQ